MEIRAVILDVDGTLLDSVDLHAEAWRRAFSKFGKEYSFQEVRQQIGKGGDQLLPVFLTKEEINRFGEELEKYRGELFREEYLDRVVAFPRTRGLVSKLRARGLKIAVGSSSNEKDLKSLIERTGIDDMLDVLVSSSDVDRSKPAPDVFEAAQEKLKIPPDQIVVIGDTPYDGVAAMRASMHFLGVLAGGFEESLLRASGAEEIFRDPADLVENLDRSKFFTKS